MIHFSHLLFTAEILLDTSKGSRIQDLNTDVHSHLHFS